jgi:hypothetical protein
VFKKEKKTSKANYRPISVLSAIPKILEKVKYDQLYESCCPVFSLNISGFCVVTPAARALRWLRW